MKSLTLAVTFFLALATQTDAGAHSILDAAGAPGDSPEITFRRQDSIARLLQLAEALAGKQFTADARSDYAAQLADRPVQDLEAALASGQPRLPGDLGSVLNDWVFTTVAPCRIYDTRPGMGVQGSGSGPLTPGVVRSLDVAGGLAVACGVPFPHAKAAALNFIAVGPSGPGNLRAWSYDTSSPPPPNASVINYQAVAGLNIANGVIQPLCNTFTATAGDCSDDVFLLADVSSTHVVIDVVGYFAAPRKTVLDCLKVDAFKTVGGPGSYTLEVTCPIDRTRTGGGIHNGAFDEVLESSPDVANGWRCIGHVPITANVACFAVCCRVPGR